MTSDQDRIDDQSWLWFLTGDTVVSETSLAHQLHVVPVNTAAETRSGLPVRIGY
jgi:hypothetical protein